MAGKSTRSKPRSEPKAEGDVCEEPSPRPAEETFSQALIRLREGRRDEVSPLLLHYLNDESARKAGIMLYQAIHYPRRGRRLLPHCCDLPPLF